MTLQPFVVAFPDIELATCEGMRTLLTTYSETGVFVGREVPNPRRSKMVIFTRDGGGSDVLDRPRLRVRVWADTDVEAQRLASKVLGLSALLADGNPVTSVRVLSGPYDVPDESKQSQRYALLEMTTRGEAITP